MEEESSGKEVVRLILEKNADKQRPSDEEESVGDDTDAEAAATMSRNGTISQVKSIRYGRVSKMEEKLKKEEGSIEEEERLKGCTTTNRREYDCSSFAWRKNER